MPGQKISGLSEVGNLEPRDFLVLARRGFNYKIAGEQFATAVDLASFREEVNTTVKQRVDTIQEKVDSELPQYIKKPATPVHGQVLTYNVAYGNWEANYVVPSKAVNSEILVYDENLKKWVNKPMFLSPESELRLRNVEDNKITKPANATNGEVLMYANNNWESRPNPVNPVLFRVAAAESQIQELINKNFIPSPVPAAPNQVLTFSGVANKWVATDPPNMYILEQRVNDQGQQIASLTQNWTRAILKPTPANPNDVLAYDGTTWVARPIQDLTGPLAFLQNQTNSLAAAQSTYIVRPTTALANDVLTFDGTKWVARSTPNYGPALAALDIAVKSCIPFPNNPVLNNVLTYDGSRWVSKPLPETSSSGVPESTLIGAVQYFAVTTPPPGWLECNGQTISNCRNIYPAFYNAITHNYADAGWGRNGNDVKLPDLRGEFIRGWDNSRGVDNGRKFGSAQQGSVGQVNIPGVASYWNGDAWMSWSQDKNSFTAGFTRTLNNPAVHQKLENFTLTVNPNTETRPRNVALLPCIRVFNASAPTQSSIDLANLAQQVNSLSQQVNSLSTKNNDFTSLNQENGYQTLPSGLIMQWGRHTTRNVRTVSFNISFPNNALNVQVTHFAADGKRSAGLKYDKVTKAGFEYVSGEGDNGDQWYPIFWFAIGF